MSDSGADPPPAARAPTASQLHAERLNTPPFEDSKQHASAKSSADQSPHVSPLLARGLGNNGIPVVDAPGANGPVSAFKPAAASTALILRPPNLPVAEMRPMHAHTAEQAAVQKAKGWLQWCLADCHYTQVTSRLAYSSCMLPQLVCSGCHTQK